MDSKKKKDDDDSGKPHKANYVYGLIMNNNSNSLTTNHSVTLNCISESKFTNNKTINYNVNPGDVVLVEAGCPDSVRQFVVMLGGVVMTVFRPNKGAMISTSNLPWTCMKNYVSEVAPEGIKPRYFVYHDDKGFNESDLRRSTYNYFGIYTNHTNY